MSALVTAACILIALTGIAVYLLATIGRNIACEFNRKGLHDR